MINYPGPYPSEDTQPTGEYEDYDVSDEHLHKQPSSPRLWSFVPLIFLPPFLLCAILLYLDNKTLDRGDPLTNVIIGLGLIIALISVFATTRR